MINIPRSLAKALPALALWLLLCTALWAYFPGLSGGFLFDDHANLRQLGAFGPIDNQTTLLRYLTSGKADPTGRPVSVASFLLDAQTWPANPRPFKNTNLLLHLLNATLLAWLLILLGRCAQLPKSHGQWAAVLGAGFWLLHPLLVSTTLYIVQREAMLPVTFGLAGLLGYLYGRNQLLTGRVWLGGALACVALGAGTLLATLSKANGALWPLLTLVLECTVLAQITSHPHRKALNWLRWLALGLPCLVLATYLVSIFPYNLDTIAGSRGWTYGQRLLTETRVVTDYLHLLWLPTPYTSGLFNDQIQASTNIWQPWTTLPCLLLIITLVGAAWLLRRRWPLLAAAVLFYFAGQLLESTFIALELYFEHRNYLPALLIFWPLAVWLTKPGSRLGSRSVLAVGLLMMLASMTHMRSIVWGDTAEQAILWEKLNPGSPRAATYAATFLAKNGHTQLAEHRIRNLINKYPDGITLTMNLVSSRCMLGSVTQQDLNQAEHSIATTDNGRRAIGLLLAFFDKMEPVAVSGQCRGFGLKQLQQIVQAAWRNPSITHSAKNRQNLYHLQGRIALAQGDVGKTLKEFSQALKADIRPATGLKQAAILGSRGYPCAGLSQINLLEALKHQWRHPDKGMPALHAWLLQRQHYWEHEINYIRRQLKLDANEKHHEGCPAKLLTVVNPNVE